MQHHAFTASLQPHARLGDACSGMSAFHPIATLVGHLQGATTAFRFYWTIHFAIALHKGVAEITAKNAICATSTAMGTHIDTGLMRPFTTLS